LSDTHITLGRKGEELAADHLLEKGFEILVRNYRQKIGEIDIIARDREWLVFVEVKTRKSTSFGQPFEAVTKKKQLQVCRVALDYMSRNKLLDQQARFDVISILINNNGKADVEHLDNCFEPGDGFF
jgi:putative endonuclease